MSRIEPVLMPPPPPRAERDEAQEKGVASGIERLANQGGGLPSSLARKKGRVAATMLAPALPLEAVNTPLPGANAAVVIGPRAGRYARRARVDEHEPVLID